MSPSAPAKAHPIAVGSYNGFFVSEQSGPARSPSAIAQCVTAAALSGSRPP
jgi:hypothetical protein